MRYHKKIIIGFWVTTENQKPPKNKIIWSSEHIDNLKAVGIDFHSTVKTSGLRPLGFTVEQKPPLAFNLYIKHDY